MPLCGSPLPANRNRAIFNQLTVLYGDTATEFSSRILACRILSGLEATALFDGQGGGGGGGGEALFQVPVRQCSIASWCCAKDRARGDRPTMHACKAPRR